MKNSIRILAIILFFTHLSNAQEGPTQTIRGVVMDANSHETLPGANVLLMNNNKGTITDMEGNFELRNIPVGRYDIQFSYVGYKSLTIPELVVGSGKEVVLEIKLEESVSELDEVVIKAEIRKDRPINSMATVSARTFSVEEARRYAGSLDDPGRMAGNFAGVATAGINVNAIIVRGNAPKGLSWRLEGVDIPVPSHFSGASVAGGGGLTMFSSQLLANSDFYTGAFPAEFGDATAGVFDMKLRNGNNQKYEYAAQIGVQGIDIAAEGPFKKNSQSSFLFNYRYSTMALIFKFLPETKDGTEIPVYQDLSFKLNMHAGDAGTFSLWGIGGLSESTSSGFDEPANWKYPENRERMNFQYNMGAAGITHKKSLSAKTFVNTTAAVNAGEHIYSEKIRLDDNNPSVLTPKHHINNIEGKITISSVLTHKFNSRITVKAGIDASNLYYKLNGDALDFSTNEYSAFMDGSGNRWMLKAHVQGKYLLTRNFTITAGANSSWFQMSDEIKVEPRLSASWQAHPKHRFSLGYGNHSQTEPLFVYFVTLEDNLTGEKYQPNKDLKRSGAHHFVIGYDWSPTRNYHLKIEPYYQALYDVPVVDGTPYSMINFRSDWLFDKELVNKGTGTNMGVDITLERYLKDGYYYISTLSIYDSKYTGGDGIERKTRYDGGYIFNILGGKEWTIKNKNLLGMNLKFSFLGPHWHHPVDLDASHLAGDIIYDDTQPFNDRYSKLESITDLTLTYRINKEKYASIWAVQIKNIFGKQYQGKNYNLETQQIENEFFSSPIPFLSYKIKF
ncbi:MAG: TonB-dependent receptor [Bacteroidales bacterium]